MATRIDHKDVGDVWQPQATFTVGGTPTDPTNLTVKQRDPTGTITTLANNVLVSGLNGSSTPVAKTGTGVFKLNPGVQLSAAGYWAVNFKGTGAAEAAETHEVIADPDPFTADSGLSSRALVTLAEAKDWLQQQNIDTSNDLDLVRVINDMSDRIHQEAEREFKVSGTNPQTRYFDVPAGGSPDPWYIDGQWMGDRSTWRRTVPVGDMAATPTQVQIIDMNWTTVLETVAAGDILSLPLNRQPWQPITHLRFQMDVTSLAEGMRVAVTGTWGFPAVPGNIRQATLDAVASVMDRDVEHYRQDLASPVGEEGGVTVMVGGGRQRLLSLPPSAAAVAWSYRPPSVG